MNMKSPKISVIIPLYNKESVVQQSLQTIVNTSYKDFEIVIVDDGSTDDSLKRVKDFVDFHKSNNIRIIEQKNAGPGAARNTGARNAKGDWIVFLDADDELLPDALNIFAKTIEEHPEIDLADFNKYNRLGTKQELNRHTSEGFVKNPMKECFLLRLLPGCGSTIYLREFFLKHLYNEKIRRFEDAELILRVLDDAKCIYSSAKPTMVHIVDYAEASKPRKDVYEDYFAYLDISKGGFWRRMCVYRTFLEERLTYSEFCKQKYKRLNRRYDLLLIFKLLNSISKYL